MAEVGADEGRSWVSNWITRPIKNWYSEINGATLTGNKSPDKISAVHLILFYILKIEYLACP